MSGEKLCSLNDLFLIQARYFKTMLRTADHLEKVKRMRVHDKDIAPLLPYYEVRMSTFTVNLLFTIACRSLSVN